MTVFKSWNWTALALAAIGTLLTVNVANAANTAFPLSEGSYKNEIRGRDGDLVNLLIKRIPGRIGSAAALLVTKEKVCAYIIDPVGTSTYGLIPLALTARGELGVVDSNPALQLTVIGGSKGGKEIGFRISLANSTSTDSPKCYAGSPRFSGVKGHVEWKDYEAGNYWGNWAAYHRGDANFGGHDKRGSSFGMYTPAEGQATVSVEGSNYNLKQKLPGLFVLKNTVLSNTGVNAVESPAGVGAFLDFPGKRLAFVKFDLISGAAWLIEKSN